MQTATSPVSGNEFRISISSDVATILPDGVESIVVSKGISACLVAKSSSDLSVHLEPQASLFLAVMPGEFHGSVQYKSTLEDSSHMHWFCVSDLGKQLDQTLVSTLVGAHARSDVDWIVVGSTAEKRRISARNQFDAREGAGEINIRGVAQDDAMLSIDAMIGIGPGGGGTDTYLTEEVLMLDSHAKVDAVPGLEIKTNDVKASHSATVHRITPEDLFYFSSRGIEQEEARAMYTAGFTGALLERVENEEVRSVLLEQLSVA